MKRLIKLYLLVSLFVGSMAVGTHVSAETYRGLTVAPENRCSDYNRSRDYRYSQSIERRIIEREGYTVDRDGKLNKPFPSKYKANLMLTALWGRGGTDIEHIVATSEAHDSGLCSRSRSEKTRYAQDLDNLTIASPQVNRFEKKGYDAAEWLPEINKVWYAETIIKVKSKYNLTIDPAERDALKAILDANIKPPVIREPTTVVKNGLTKQDKDRISKLVDDIGDALSDIETIVQGN